MERTPGTVADLYYQRRSYGALATDSDSHRLLPRLKGLRVDAEHRPASAVESASNIAQLRTRDCLLAAEVCPAVGIGDAAVCG